MFLCLRVFRNAPFMPVFTYGTIKYITSKPFFNLQFVLVGEFIFGFCLISSGCKHQGVTYLANEGNFWQYKKEKKGDVSLGLFCHKIF
jgi:hypothetical protein